MSFWIEKMRRLLSWLVICMILQFQACMHLPNQAWHRAKIYRQTWVLGDTPVVIQREDYGPGKIFVHVHANETTALEAARLVARSQGGQIITLIHAKTREIRFNYHGKSCAFDPNRIYTTQGIQATLNNYHCNSPKLRALAAGFAKQVIAAIPPGELIGVHNNNGYSLKDYLPQHGLASDAADLYWNPKRFYRNFYFVTQKSDFKRYKAMGFNVVLQASIVSDDGSMSVYFKHRQYANVEAGYDQLFSQIRMLQSA